MKKYQDEQWLINNYITENKTIGTIAEKVNVSDVTIRRYLRKYGIEKDKQLIYKSRQSTRNPIRDVVITCNECGNNSQKSVRYYKQRVRDGVDTFYCSRKCADNHHSKEVSGKSNPNYGGIWHAQCPSDWSKEKRELATKRMVETVIREGTFRGMNNGRWAGGEQKHRCIICDKEASFSPYVHRLILKGDRSPCCSNKCAAALGRRNIKYESTSIEVAMANELERRDIEYIAQYNLGDKFSLDFLLPEYDIVIECDGDYWHNLPEVKTRDKSKNAYIKACGYSLYRFWEHEINTDVVACVDIVLAEINESIA